MAIRFETPDGKVRTVGGGDPKVKAPAVGILSKFSGIGRAEPPDMERTKRLEARVEALEQIVAAQSKQVTALAATLKSMLVEHETPVTPVTRPSVTSVTPLSNAERQRRYRERKTEPKLQRRMAAGEKIIWHVYGLVDPRTNEIFYVGATTDPEMRKNAHKSDSASAAWHRIQEIAAAGLEHDIKVIKKFADKKTAIDHENYLIKSMPSLVNLSFPGLQNGEVRDSRAAKKLGLTIAEYRSKNERPV